MDTALLIDRLATGAAPVRRLPPPWRRAALWLALAVPYALAIVALYRLFIEGHALVWTPRFVIEQAAAFATALTASHAAFSSLVPGRDRRWLLVPLGPLAVWLASLGAGCLDDFLRLGPAALTLAADWECLPPMLVIASLPGAAMFLMIRRGAPLMPKATVLLATLAVAGLANFGLQFFHSSDASLLVLVWHFGGLVVASLVGWALGPLVISWRRIFPVIAKS